MRRYTARDPVDYQVERHNECWPDHLTRALVTSALIATLRPDSILDPAAGDGSIIAGADAIRPISYAVVGDISALNCKVLAEWGYADRVINDDILAILDLPGHYDVVVLTEILEHLGNPDEVLMTARQRARYLVASSPEMRPGQVDDNVEHVWAFDGDGYKTMLTAAGWKVASKTHLGLGHSGWPYDFAIWVAER